MTRALLVAIVTLLLVPTPADAHVAVKDDHLRAVVLELRADVKARLHAGQWRAARRIIDAESHWNPRSTTGACYGLPQACPASKLRSAIRPHRGARWDSIHDPYVQWAWFTAYVHGRYGTMKRAYRFQQLHRWY